MLIQNTVPHRVFTIRHRLGDGKFVSRNDKPGDQPLSFDDDLDGAIASTRNAACLEASAGGCKILIMAENPSGYLESVAAVHPQKGPACQGSFVVLL